MTESAGKVPGRIFMSYRREDTAYPAGWLYDRLAGHFGRSQVFKDIDSIELGDDFVEVINAAVESCDVLLALIGDRWLTATGQDGQRRLDNPGDFVRLEIEAALTRNVRVIPILVEGARMPGEDELPASLAKLAYRQALELSPSRFAADTRRLLKVLDRTISEAQEQASQRAETEATRHRQQVGQLQERAAAQDWDAAGTDRQGSGDAERRAREQADHQAQEKGGMAGLLFRRHGALVLDPADAVVVDGQPAPEPTVYRAGTLLVPGNLLQDGDTVASINQVLEHAGMRLIPPAEDPDRGLDADSGYRMYGRDRVEMLRELSRPAVLRPLAGAPVKIDAWAALQTLRAAAAQNSMLAEVVEHLELEHVLTGSAVASPAGLEAGPGGSDISRGAEMGSYPPTPVVALLHKPERKSATECAERFGRRPVVAVLDTGIRAHSWLGVTAAPGGGYFTDPDGFVAVDLAIQAAIYAEGQHAVACGDLSRHLIKDAADTLISANPLAGKLNPAFGRGTFIAGIVRQVAADARVLAVRVVHSDGIVYEGDIIVALRCLAERIVLAEADDLAAMVDVVSLSLGYFSESRDGVVTSGLLKAINVLLDLGVVVVAAAGNFATSRRFYPAAFALEPVPAGHLPVISVGVNRHVHDFLFQDMALEASERGPGSWITAWGPGGAIISTYPADLRLAADHQTSDPDDDFSSGFARWDSPWFGAPQLAAQIARALCTGAEDSDALRLDLPGLQAAENLAETAAKKAKRAAAAMDRLRS
jgi:hypothetical protein